MRVLAKNCFVSPTRLSSRIFIYDWKSINIILLGVVSWSIWSETYYIDRDLFSVSSFKTSPFRVLSLKKLLLCIFKSYSSETVVFVLIIIFVSGLCSMLCLASVQASGWHFLWDFFLDVSIVNLAQLGYSHCKCCTHAHTFRHIKHIS